ncbi:MAG: hypothetical protein P4M04_11455 [Acidobacteriota bacterium]|nr:hypothetical protein [Acidobacteriota bacterium]
MVKKVTKAQVPVMALTFHDGCRKTQGHHAWAVCAERECVDGGSAGSDAEGDFAKRLERGKLTFTGDVLQVRSVSGRQQKAGKLFKRLKIGA